MTSDLVSKAKAVLTARPVIEQVSDEEIDLLIAYLNGEVSTPQIEIAMNWRRNSGGRFRNWFTRAIRTAWLKGRIVAVPVPPAKK